MHVAAANPLALNGDDLDTDLVARERAIAEEKAAQSGKPAEIVGQMVDGSIAKYRKENALLSPLLLMDGKPTVAEVVAAAGQAVGRAEGGRVGKEGGRRCGCRWEGSV